MKFYIQSFSSSDSAMQLFCRLVPPSTLKSVTFGFELPLAVSLLNGKKRSQLRDERQRLSYYSFLFFDDNLLLLMTDTFSYLLFPKLFCQKKLSPVAKDPYRPFFHVWDWSIFPLLENELYKRVFNVPFTSGHSNILIFQKKWSHVISRDVLESFHLHQISIRFHPLCQSHSKETIHKQQTNLWIWSCQRFRTPRPRARYVKYCPLSLPIRLEDLEDSARSQAWKKFLKKQKKNNHIDKYTFTGKFHFVSSLVR